MKREELIDFCDYLEKTMQDSGMAVPTIECIDEYLSLSPSPQPTSEAEGMTVGIDIKALKKHLEETPLEQLQDEWAQFVKDWPSSPQPSATAEKKMTAKEWLIERNYDPTLHYPHSLVVDLLEEYAAKPVAEDRTVRDFRTVEERGICSKCGKYKSLQGNGIAHQLCECAAEREVPMRADVKTYLEAKSKNAGWLSFRHFLHGVGYGTEETIIAWVEQYCAGVMAEREVPEEGVDKSGTLLARITEAALENIDPPEKLSKLKTTKERNQ